jgi:hypothetical protein
VDPWAEHLLKTSESPMGELTKVDVGRPYKKNASTFSIDHNKIPKKSLDIAKYTLKKRNGRRFFQ